MPGTALVVDTGHSYGSRTLTWTNRGAKERTAQDTGKFTRQGNDIEGLSLTMTEFPKLLYSAV